MLRQIAACAVRLQAGFRWTIQAAMDIYTSCKLFCGCGAGACRRPQHAGKRRPYEKANNMQPLVSSASIRAIRG